MGLYGEGISSRWNAMTKEEAETIRTQFGRKDIEVLSEKYAPSFKISDNGIPKKYVDLAEKITSDLKSIYQQGINDEYWDWPESPKHTNWDSNIKGIMFEYEDPNPHIITLAFLKDCDRFIAFNDLLCDNLSLSLEDERKNFSDFKECLCELDTLCRDEIKKENCDPATKQLIKGFLLDKFEAYERYIEDMLSMIDREIEDRDIVIETE